VTGAYPGHTPGIALSGAAPTRGSLVPFHTPTNIHFIIIYIPRLYLFLFLLKIIAATLYKCIRLDKKRRRKLVKN